MCLLLPAPTFICPPTHPTGNYSPLPGSQAGSSRSLLQGAGRSARPGPGLAARLLAPLWLQGVKRRCQYNLTFRRNLEGCQHQCALVIQVPRCCKGYFGRDCHGEAPCHFAAGGAERVTQRGDPPPRAPFSFQPARGARIPRVTIGASASTSTGPRGSAGATRASTGRRASCVSRGGSALTASVRAPRAARTPLPHPAAPAHPPAAATRSRALWVPTADTAVLH